MWNESCVVRDSDYFRTARGSELANANIFNHPQHYRVRENLSISADSTQAFFDSIVKKRKDPVRGPFH